jgi:hypothetical protein
MDQHAAVLPTFAAWTHAVARDGFEVVFMHQDPGGMRMEGYVSAVEEGVPWAVRYTIATDGRWRTRAAHVWGRTSNGVYERTAEADGNGNWRIDGSPEPHLDGCLDLDLEASSCTNALPVRRLALEVGAAAEAPAAYVRVLGGAVERLEQRYARIEDDGPGTRYDYTAPIFDFRAVLAYDPAGLILDYPGIAVRAY